METEDKKATLKGIYSKMVGATEVDHELEPLTWPSLKTKWQEKSLGTGYLDQESEKIGNLYQLLPEELRTNIREGAIGINTALTDWNRYERDTNPSGMGPLDSFIAMEWGIDKIGDLFTLATGVDNRYFDFGLGYVSKGAVANRILKRINTVQKYNASKTWLDRLKIATEVGDQFEIEKLLKQGKILDKQFQERIQASQSIKAKLSDLNPDYAIRNKTNRGLYKQLYDQDPTLIDQAEEIIKELDLFKTSEGTSQGYGKWSENRPTTGFKGTRTVPYIDKQGNPSEVAFRWSVSKNNYVPYDLIKRQNTILRRLRWNVNRSTKAKWYADKVYKISKADNKVLRELLTELRQKDPQKYFDIMGDTRNYAEKKGFIFVEHIHAQNSPYWKYVSKGQFKPRDTSNLMIVKNEEFGKLKTSIENHIYNNKDFVYPEGKRLLLDYDKTRDVLVLKQIQDNGRLSRVGDISPITNPRNWKQALNAAFKGHRIEKGKLGEIQQVIQADPDLPPFVNIIDDIERDIDPRFTQ